jgi:hypothetical protein
LGQQHFAAACSASSAPRQRRKNETNRPTTEDFVAKNLFDKTQYIVFLVPEMMNTAFTKMQKQAHVNGRTTIWQYCSLPSGNAGVKSTQ